MLILKSVKRTAVILFTGFICFSFTLPFTQKSQNSASKVNNTKTAGNNYVQDRKLLSEAIKKNDLKQVQNLLSDCLNLEDEDVEYTHYTPFLEAVEHGKEEIIKYLAEAGANLNACNEYKHNGIYIALNSYKLTIEQKEKTIALLLELGLKVKDQYKDSLNEAIRLDAEKIVTMLIDAGADIKKGRHFDNELLLNACKNCKKSDLVQLFVDLGGDINFKDHYDHQTPLMAAAKEGNLKAIKLLLQLGADKNIKDANKRDAFSYVVESNSVESAYLLFQESSLNSVDGFGFTPLIRAVVKNNVEMVQFLIENKVDINYSTKIPVRIGVYKNHYTFTPEVDAFASGATALTFAKKYKLFDIHEILLKAGAIDPYIYQK